MSILPSESLSQIIKRGRKENILFRCYGFELGSERRFKVDIYVGEGLLDLGDR